jgi:multiple sugar transport system substrate-binding protein
MSRARSMRLLGAIAALAAAAGLSSCGSSSEGGPVTLNWFIFNEPSGAYQEAAKRCSEQSGGRYKIDFQYLPAQADAQREQLVRRLAAEDPSLDILGMDVIWTAEFANAGWVLDWTGERKREVTKNVFPSVIDTASFENKLYAAPFTSNTQLLWYRTDRVQQPPKTWDQMIQMGEKIGSDGLVQVQANRYEGFTVWAVAMIESAGGTILDGPETVGLAPEPTEAALAEMGKFAQSSVAPPNIDTSTEDTARLAFEAGNSTFMLNYPFVYPSAKENAPDVFKNMGFAKYPRVVADMPSRPPLGGINLGVSAFSEHPDLAFDAVTCLRQPKNQITAAELGGLPPTREDVYDTKAVQAAYPGFADLIKRSIQDAAPRPLTPAYQDVSLAIQRALHPVGQIDPSDPTPAYDELHSLVEDAVNRTGLL